MKNRTLTVAVFVLLGTVIMTGCEEFLSQIETVNFTMNRPIMDEDVDVQSTIIPLVGTANLSGSGGVAKITATGWIEIKMTISDYILLVNVLTEGGAAFTGTAANNAANAVTFSLFISQTSGLADPLTEATEIFSEVIAPGGVFDLSGISDFTTALGNFFTANPGLEEVYIYIMGDADPVLDVTVSDVTFVMPPSVRITEQISYEDVAEYEGLYEEVVSGDIDGIIANNGTADVSMVIYVSVIGPDFMPEWIPPAEDVILEILVEPGSSVVVSDFVNESLLHDRIDSLFANQFDLFVTAILMSVDPILASLQDIRLEASVSVSR